MLVTSRLYRMAVTRPWTLLDQSWRRGKRTSTYGAAAKLVMRILTCLFIYLTRTQEVE
jgi:hypothetical protein